MSMLPFRLKELALKERHAKSKLQIDLQQLKEEAARLGKELNMSQCKEEDRQKALRALEETLSKMETQRVQERASEVELLFLIVK